MRRRQPGKSELPRLWLVSDARNDAVLERAIARLPRGSGLIFRHYHLAEGERRARFDRLARLVRRRGGVIVLAGGVRQARRWKADGFYGPPGGGAAGGLIRLVTAHDLRELRRANVQHSVFQRKPEKYCNPTNTPSQRSPPRTRGSSFYAQPQQDSGIPAFAGMTTGATLVLISPIFPTRTHPGGKTLGIARFSTLARHAHVPVIALGGMTRARAQQMAGIIDGWAAIDGLSG